MDGGDAGAETRYVLSDTNNSVVNTVMNLKYQIVAEQPGFAPRLLNRAPAMRERHEVLFTWVANNELVML